MKKTKLISLLLVAVMIMTCLTIAGVSTSAASGDTVYFDNSVTKFPTVYCYMWGDGKGENAAWPGVQMTNVSGDIWAYAVTGDYDKIIFDAGQGGTQSTDLTYPGNGQIATPNSADNNFNVSWAPYTGSETVPTNTTSATSPTTSGGNTGGVGSVYCQNDAGWSTVYCYMWNSENDKNAAWPGVKMTDLGDNVWEYNYSKNYANVIFSQNGTPQTDDLVLPGDSYIYNNSTKNWEPYSNSPVKITAFSTSIESPSYTGVSVTISATAKSAEGALSYKFSVKDQNGGITTLSDGSSSSVAWIPTSAGKYTITVDVKDTAGNENSRSINNFEVKDATTLETAFITAFSNSLGTFSQIKQNSNITFTLSAIGGKTGNGLLFYKFVITDPDGNNNVAYYTTSNNYSYTPTKLGAYTIKAYAQNSYNDTVYKTYTYTSVANIDEKPGDTTPAVTSTTSPTTATTATTTATQETTSGGDVGGATDSPATSPSTTQQQTTVANPQLGDVNHDGTVNIIDATKIQKAVALISVTDYDATLADTDKDGNITIKDATLIMKYVAKMITSF